jgi:hypothetical protein
MLRVQNQAKKTMSFGLSLVVVVARGDLQVARSPDQNKIHSPPPPRPFAGTSREPVTEWGAQIEVGAVGQGKSMKKRCSKKLKVNFMNNNAHRARQKFSYNYLT